MAVCIRHVTRFQCRLEGLGMPKSLPFSVYKRVGRRYFYVSFKNEKTSEYFPAVSTRQESEKTAIETVSVW
jgi:hypothetical protein